MKKSSWIKGATMALSLAAAGMLYGQNSVPDYRTNDGIFATPKTATFSKEKDISLRQYLGDGKDATFYALDPIVILKGKLNYLKENGPEVQRHYTPASRQQEIAYCQTRLAEVSKEKRDAKYFQDLKRLENAVKDGIITRDEMEGLEENVTFGLGEKSKTFDVPMFTRFTEAQSNAGTGYQIQSNNAQIQQYSNSNSSGNQLPSQPPILLTPLPPANTDVPNQGASKETPDASLMTPKTGEYNEKQKLPLPQIPQVQTSQTSQSPISEVKKSTLELYLDVLASPNMVGGRAGLTGKLFDLGSGIETRGGIGISGAYGFSEVVDSSQSIPNPATGRYFVYTTTNENLVKLGLDFNLSIGDKNGNLFIGGGPNVWIYGQKDSVDLWDSTSVVKPNSNTELGATLGLDAYLGYQVKWLRFLVGFDSMKKFYGETGVSIPLN